MSNTSTANRTLLNGVTLVVAFIVAAVVLVVAVVGLYLGGWWIHTDATNRQAHLDRANYGTQTALVHDMHDKVEQIAAVDVQLTYPNLSDAQRNALAAQRKAMVTTTCSLNENVTQDLPSDLAIWVAANC